MKTIMIGPKFLEMMPDKTKKQIAQEYKNKGYEVEFITEAESKELSNKPMVEQRTDVPQDILDFLEDFGKNLKETLDFSKPEHRRLYSHFAMHTGIWR